MTAPTLIVIDVQHAFEDPAWGERNNPGAERRIAQAIACWRERGAPLIHEFAEVLSTDTALARLTSS